MAARRLEKIIGATEAEIVEARDFNNEELRYLLEQVQRRTAERDMAFRKLLAHCMSRVNADRAALRDIDPDILDEVILDTVLYAILAYDLDRTVRDPARFLTRFIRARARSRDDEFWERKSLTTLDDVLENEEFETAVTTPEMEMNMAEMTGPDEALELKTLSRRLRREFDEDELRILDLKRDGLSNTEIGERMGWHRNTVSKYSGIALNKLAKIVGAS